MKKYLHLIRISLVNRLDYRQEMVASVFVGLMMFAGQAIFWWAVFSGKEMVNGFTLPQIMVYFLFARIVSELIDSKVGFTVSEMILSGQVSNMLLKPVTVPIWLFFHEVGNILVDIIVKAGIIMLIFYFVLGAQGVVAKQLPFFIVSLIASVMISYGIFFLTGCVAFWTDNAASMNYALRRAILFLSGGLVPLTFFPTIFQDILRFSPFPYIFSLPMKILTSPISLKDIFFGLGIQAVWAGFLFVFIKFIFVWAVKNNESVGI